MKKPMLYTALVALFCTTSHYALAASNNVPPPQSETNSQKPETTASATTPSTPPKVDCSFKITPNSLVDKAIILPWAEKATQQSFDFKYDAIDKQLTALKACYTDQGWQSFNDALQKSGNITAITSQKLTVSTSVSGTSRLTEVKDNQWKVNVPIEVLYQNDKDKITQSLNVDLLVGRKPSGDLGIMQIVVSPANIDKDSKDTKATTVQETNAKTKDSAAATPEKTPKN